MNNTKYLVIIITILLCQNIYSQREVNDMIRSQAEKVVTSVFEGKYDTLIKYTHPRIIEIIGGKEAMLSMIKTQMKEFEKQDVTIDKIEIGDSIVSKIYKNEYHALIPKIMTMSVQGQKIMMKSYLFGFSNKEGKNWTFLEADKLRSKTGSAVLPDFETDIEIPKKGQPILIESFSENPKTMTLQISWDELEIGKRHDLESRIDKILRTSNLGFCSGGDNERFKVSEVNIYLTINRSEKQKVIDLIDKELSKLNLSNYDWLVFE